jgi:hypothetical protein
MPRPVLAQPGCGLATPSADKTCDASPSSQVFYPCLAKPRLDRPGQALRCPTLHCHCLAKPCASKSSIPAVPSPASPRQAGYCRALTSHASPCGAWPSTALPRSSSLLSMSCRDQTCPAPPGPATQCRAWRRQVPTTTPFHAAPRRVEPGQAVPCLAVPGLALPCLASWRVRCTADPPNLQPRWRKLLSGTHALTSIASHSLAPARRALARLATQACPVALKQPPLHALHPPSRFPAMTCPVEPCQTQHGQATARLAVSCLALCSGARPCPTMPCHGHSLAY